MVYNPISTYRIQFHEGFRLDEVNKISGYLSDFGISTLYASPLFEARPGSNHGYDVTDFHKINPQIGDYEQLKSLARSLKEKNIGWLQDIVPNHMAFDKHNWRLMDVMEKGRKSDFYHFFDVNWDHHLTSLRGKLMVPFLGAPLKELLENREIVILRESGVFFISYYENRYPLYYGAYRSLLEGPRDGGMSVPSPLMDIVNSLMALEKNFDDEEFQGIKDGLNQLIEEDKRVFDHVKGRIEYLHANPDQFLSLLDQQPYKLAYWQKTENQISYRRFFTVNDLICLNIQLKEVFDHYHILIKELIDENIVDGVRIDHIDGLYSPLEYLQKLRSLTGADTYIAVEKILEEDEAMPENWPVEGSTGYEFLALCNNLLTYKKSQRDFSKIYGQFTGMEAGDYHDIVYEKKKFILQNRMRGEWDNLVQQLKQTKLFSEKEWNGFGEEAISKVLGQILICFPVYRAYPTDFPLSGTDVRIIENTFTLVKKRIPEQAKLVDRFKSIFLPEKDAGEPVWHFLKRVMQYTGPLMAKGVEDTTFYVYNRFAAHNEVGDNPGSFGISVEEFHSAMTERQINTPMSQNTTSTHDTKRGEDVRARLNVLSELPGLFKKAVKRWKKINAEAKTEQMPDENDEYFMYQTLLGIYPMDKKPTEDFQDRVKNYMQKALREAKQHSSWSEPDVVYEKATQDFIQHILNNAEFQDELKSLLGQIKDFGIINSLTQVVLKNTCPGVPDTYQGSELWNLSMVDPDNRRPVDYEKRHKFLNEIQRLQETVEKHEVSRILWESRDEGMIKLWFASATLKMRQSDPDLFLKGEYLPLEVEGKYKKHVLAYARRYRNQCLVVIVPLFTFTMTGGREDKLLDWDWKDTKVKLPEFAPLEWQDILLRKSFETREYLLLREIVGPLPFGIYTGNRSTGNRKAGVLMHIASLPGRFGIGDLGDEAFRFVDFLRDAEQRIWQVLPINPIEKDGSFSPYSSNSAFAGNPLFINIPRLLNKSWAKNIVLEDLPDRDPKRVDYQFVEVEKNKCFDQLIDDWNDNAGGEERKNFTIFVEQNHYWIHDYCLYTVVKSKQGKPWYKWAAPLRDRHSGAMEKWRRDYAKEINRQKLLQYFFYQQWSELKSYCFDNNVQLFGDIPIYVSYDSADVWAHPHFFKLNSDKSMKSVAGVPPDYFSKTGQLWGMPIFDWGELKVNDYEWWVERIRKNLQNFDLVRLDHFRAFSAFWEVPAGKKTAVDGEWKTGPGNSLFDFLQEKLGPLPLIAEDLGDIDDAVYQLRDRYEFPGMRVLQFAFGEDSKDTLHIPHHYTQNSVAYTGTHDNNTMRGWYAKDAEKKSKNKVEKYLGGKVKIADIHWKMIRLLYASVADIVVIPMQDILGLGQGAMMNKPSTTKGNWRWKITRKQLKKVDAAKLRELVSVYFRG